MNGQRHATMVAAASLCLTLTPLAGIFEGLAWTLPVVLTVAIVATAGSLVRSAGRGQGIQTLAMAGALTVLMTVMFNGGTAIAFLIPTPGTLSHWLNLVGQGVNDIIVLAPPVAPEGGILFLTVTGVGIVAILHDMFVVGLRTPALAGLTLLTMYLVPVSVAPDATAWFWFILPAVAYLWILADDNLRRVSRFGHRFTGSGHLVGPRFPSPLAATARVTGAVFVALTLLLLAVVPTNTSGLVDQVAQGYGGGDGPGDGELGGLDPWAQLSGSLNQPDPIDVLRVTTDDPSPRYLRMHVADVLTDSGFHPSSYDDLESLGSLDDAGSQEVFTAQVENLALEEDRVAPVYGRPVSLDLGDEWGVEPDTGVIVSEDSSMADVEEYTLQYTDPDWDAATLAAAASAPVDSAVFERNTKHPDVPELTRIVDQIMSDAGAETVHEKALAVLDHLSPANGFSYSLETVDAGNDEAILDFLETKEGYCQQYAAAMAWMLREADVPARVAIGLTKGSYSDGTWLISSDNFHAWVEVYYEGLGWVDFDPTPSSGVSDSVYFPWAVDPAEDTETVEQEDSVPGEQSGEPTPTEAPTRPEEQAADEEGELTAQNAADEPEGIAPAWLALLPLLAVPFVPALWRSALRRSRLAPRRLDAQSAWDETRDLALDYGIELRDSFTPRQTAATLAQAVPDARGAVEALASAMEHHRYSPRGADASRLPAAVKDLRILLDKNTYSSRRFGAIFWPASLAARFSEQRGRASTKLSGLRAKLLWPRRSNGGGDGAVAGRP
jgi:transglutaminase-like putative cysteine protease